MASVVSADHHASLTAASAAADRRRQSRSWLAWRLGAWVLMCLVLGAAGTVGVAWGIARWGFDESKGVLDPGAPMPPAVRPRGDYPWDLRGPWHGPGWTIYESWSEVPRNFHPPLEVAGAPRAELPALAQGDLPRHLGMAVRVGPPPPPPKTLHPSRALTLDRRLELQARATDTRRLPPSESSDTREVRFGWPMRSMWVAYDQHQEVRNSEPVNVLAFGEDAAHVFDAQPLQLFWGTPGPAWPKAKPASDEWAFPIGVVPLGFAVNTLMLSALLFLMLTPWGWPRVRLWRRLREGRCLTPRCGYSLAGVAVGSPCPECGAERV